MSYSTDLNVLFFDKNSKTGVDEFTYGLFPGNIRKMYHQRPGFFTPYKGVGDFVKTVSAPVVDPLIFGFYSSVCLMVSAVSAIICMGLTLTALVPGVIFGDSNFRSKTMDNAGTAGLIGVLSFGFGLMSAAVALLSIPYNIISLISRSIASICCCGSSSEPDEHLDAPGASTLVSSS